MSIDNNDDIRGTVLEKEIEAVQKSVVIIDMAINYRDKNALSKTNVKAKKYEGKAGQFLYEKTNKIVQATEAEWSDYINDINNIQMEEQNNEER